MIRISKKNRGKKQKKGNGGEVASNYIDKGANFSSMMLDKRVLRAVSRLSFSHPTVVQVKKKGREGRGGEGRGEGGGWVWLKGERIFFLRW